MVFERGLLPRSVMTESKKGRSIVVQGTTVAVARRNEQDYISLTDMLRAKDGEFFISDWLRNRNTVEFLGVWERVHNPAFNYGEFATIKSQAGLNSYKVSVKEWVAKTNAIGLRATVGRYGGARRQTIDVTRTLTARPNARATFRGRDARATWMLVAGIRLG